MQIYGLFTNTGVTRPTATGTSTAGNGEVIGSGAAAQRLLADDETSASRAAIAKKKLDDIKEQLRMLRFWASDPETLAKLAKQLAQQLGTVAQQLAGAGASSGTAAIAGASGVSAAAASAATLAETASAQGSDDSTDANAGLADRGKETDAAADRSTFVQRAYREFSGADDQSDSTASLAAELKSVAEQVKQLLRKAEQDLRAKGSVREADEARAAGQALSASVDQLGGIDMVAGGSSRIPTSVSV
ncbi:hypothetical protein [Ensifer sp.]|jgi:hypothetical protein|uniref:hypothetical protein n=1 Tax=Ensifer sp. TaxID=1872086 RepID=UPI002E0D5E0E|nr:hypothetical protein [Ensifer sp.]